MSAAQLIAEYQSIFIINCCDYALTAAVLYEYVITFSQEYRFIWHRKWTGATVLFIANRYPMVILQLITPLSDGTTWHHRSVCKAVGILDEMLTLFALFASAVFSAFRAYAISGNRWPLGLLVFSFAVIPFAVNAYLTSALQFKILRPPLAGCNNGPTTPEDKYNHRTIAIAMHTCAIAADFMVLLITWWKTYETQRAARSVHLKASLAVLLIRDGTVYFFVLLLLNLLRMVLLVTIDFAYFADFINPLTSILISRFILNLRQIYYARPSGLSGLSSLSQDASKSSGLSSTLVIGNMGAPMQDESLFVEFAGPGDEVGVGAAWSSGDPVSVGVKAEAQEEIIELTNVTNT